MIKYFSVFRLMRKGWKMLQSDFQARLKKALQALNGFLRFSKTPGLYDHQSVGFQYQIDIENLRLQNAAVERSDDRHNAVVYSLKRQLESCVDGDAVWKMIIDSFQSILGVSVAYRLNDEGIIIGIDWPAVYDQVKQIDFMFRENADLQVDCLRAIYSQFWK